MADDKSIRIKELTFTGKLITHLDGTLIGENFKTLTNLRYTDRNVRGIGGMTQINTTPLTSHPLIHNGMHFIKEQPAESHILIQAYNSGETESKVFQNITAVPNQGDFSATALHTDASGANGGRFSLAPGGTVAYCNGKESMIWGGDEYRCAGFINYDEGGNTFSYDFTDILNNTLTDASNLATLTPDTSGAADGWMYVGSTRPLKGIKIYVDTANTAAATLATKYWNGTAWAAVSSISDGTASGGVPLAQTGYITFDDTDGSAKTQAIEGTMLYWYQIQVPGMDATTVIYYCTVDTAWQSIKDVWGGELQPITSAQMSTNTAARWPDVTILVAEADLTNFIDMNGFPTSNALYFGFSEQLTGMRVQMGDEVQQTASRVLVLKYWNGTAWTAVSNLTDGTSKGGQALNQSGYVWWSAPTPTSEVKLDLNDQGVKLYYYQLKWSGLLSQGEIDQVEGVRASKEIQPFKFPLFAHNRLFLCGEINGKKNMVVLY